MRLVIAEKPSVAQSIAAILGAKKRSDGYLAHFVMSAYQGHRQQ